MFSTGSRKKSDPPNRRRCCYFTDGNLELSDAHIGGPGWLLVESGTVSLNGNNLVNNLYLMDGDANAQEGEWRSVAGEFRNFGKNAGGPGIHKIARDVLGSKTNESSLYEYDDLHVVEGAAAWTGDLDAATQNLYTAMKGGWTGAGTEEE